MNVVKVGSCFWGLLVMCKYVGCTKVRGVDVVCVVFVAASSCHGVSEGFRMWVFVVFCFMIVHTPRNLGYCVM